MRRGHIYRRALHDGRPSRWYAVIDADRRGGRRRQVARSFATRAQAEQWLATVRSEHPDDAGATLAQWLPQWLASKAGVKASTRAFYRAHVERYLIPMLGRIPLRLLTPLDVQRWHADLLAAGVDPASIVRIHATLSSALGTARRQGLIERNPLAGVELPRRRPYRRTVWTAAQAAAFLAGVRADPWEGLWRLALLAGLRRGELVGLRWRDVDLDAAAVTVDGTRLRVGAAVVEDGPKSAASYRTVQLDPVTVAVLRRARVLSTGGEHGHAFTGPDGRPLDPAAVSRRFHELREHLGLPRIRLHDLRHTSATLGLASGESLKEVSARLGHAGIAVTADLYTDVAPDLARASAHRLAAALDGRGAA